MKASEIGFLLVEHPDIFERRISGEHLKLIVFVCHEMTKGEGSFWHPYFQITEKTDMLMQWGMKDLEQLQDTSLVDETLLEKAFLQEEYLVVIRMIQQYPKLFNPDLWTFEVFTEAFVLVVTRCFGYELPGLMLLPYADLANHHCIDGAFDIYNERIQAQGKEATEGDELAYWYRSRKGFNYTKHFVEEPFDKDFPLNYKTTMYAKKVELRN